MSPPRRELESNTPALTHLWRSANTLLSSAPTVSAHLGHVLLFSAADGAGRLAQRLQCRHCGALLTNARVRVRGGRKRTRRNDNPATTVVRTCVLCERHDAVVTKTREEAANDREERRHAAKVAAEIAKAEKKKGKNKKQRPTAPTAESRPKKKQKRKPKNNSSGVIVRTAARSAAPRAPQSGLRTASFLFEPLD